MAEDKLGVGATVMLKSGGPRMTVVSLGNSIQEGRVGCAWFCKGKYRAASFPIAPLDTKLEAEVAK